ncbi:MAG: hypothetical protein KDJ37_09040 [Hyphomicrobiaceae bacterium]|nr:hypothetical protein [Hyphomicrobiaceae bacterium]
MRRAFSVAILVAGAAAISGCASSSSKVMAQYISPMQYNNYSCAQLADEGQRVSARAAQLAGVQDQKASNDAVATGVAIVLFWPAAFLVGGDDQTTAELGRLKGEFETIEKVSVQKNCGHQFRGNQGRPGHRDGPV